MRQLLLTFEDDAAPSTLSNRKGATVSMVETVAPTEAELAILRELDLERELELASGPEERQRVYARFAAHERQHAVESRSPRD